jgi:hypothetical protein
MKYVSYFLIFIIIVVTTPFGIAAISSGDWTAMNFLFYADMVLGTIAVWLLPRKDA